MAAFRSLTSDKEPLKRFVLEAFKCSKIVGADKRNAKSDLPLHLFEWSQSRQDGAEFGDVKSVSDLEARDAATVRVM